MTACTNEFRAVIDPATDGSRLHNVTGTIDNGAAGQLAINIGCTSRRHALALAEALNAAAWIEVEAQDYEAPAEPHPSACRCRDCADARGDWQYHDRLDRREA